MLDSIKNDFVLNQWDIAIYCSKQFENTVLGPILILKADECNFE